MDHITLMKHLLTQPYIDDYGLKYFFEFCKDLGIAKELIKALYEAIVDIHKLQIEPLIEFPPIPEAVPIAEGEEPKPIPEEIKVQHEAIVSEIKLKNQVIEA